MLCHARRLACAHAEHQGEHGDQSPHPHWRCGPRCPREALSRALINAERCRGRQDFGVDVVVVGKGFVDPLGVPALQLNLLGRADACARHSKIGS